MVCKPIVICQLARTCVLFLFFLCLRLEPPSRGVQPPSIIITAITIIILLRCLVAAEGWPPPCTRHK